MTKEEFLEAISSAVQEELKDCCGEDEEILKTSQVLDMLGVSKPTLYVYIEKGLIPQYKVEGRVFFLKSEVIKMIKNGRQDLSE